MTTRWRQKASSILAVVCVIGLLLLIIFLWTAVKNGMFTTNNNSPYNKINISSDHRKFIEIHQRTPNLNNNNNNNNNENITFNGTITIELPSPRPPDINRSSSDPLNEIFVRPSKIHVQPLHRDDLLYESQKFDDPHADTKGEVPDHRITGQFRNKSSRIWDPHPQYVIDAFGIRMHLVLNQDAGFIPKNMKISSSFIWSLVKFWIQYNQSELPLLPLQMT